jgi:hypothetical protein
MSTYKWGDNTSLAADHSVLGSANTTDDVQMMTSGQVLPHSGLTGFASGQHGMVSPCIPGMLAIVSDFENAIAFSAAIMLTGATSIPSSAQSDMNRNMTDTNFITMMVARRVPQEKGVTKNCPLEIFSE